MGTSPRRQRPSYVWLVSAVPTLVVAVAFVTAAVTFQRQATRPIGEGELFRADAEWVVASLREAPASDLDAAVRRARNRLGIEAVSALAPDGRIVASTTGTLSGTDVSPGLLGFAFQNGRFAALAAPTAGGIEIDGVEEWAGGSTLYQVLHPGDDGGAVLLHYDLAELLHRRARGSGIQPGALQLGGIGLILFAVGLALVAGRRVAARRIREARREAEALQARSRELERHNVELDEARRAAERALELAEETNRIRSEFVLMINHELRTPLTSVVTGAEVLRAGIADDETAGRVLDDMVRDGRRLHELIAQILNVARIENRGLSYTLADVAAADVLAGVEQRARATVERSGAGGVVRADPDGLVQLLISLSDNAFVHGAGRVGIRTTDELPFVPQLVVGDRRRTHRYFLVEDDGPGINPEFLPRAFEKFEKQSFDSGTGLGLYLARLMIEAMDGCIAVHTGPDGSTMAVGVPLAAQVAEVVA